MAKASKTFQHIIHSIQPVYDENSSILILGTLPSVKSREENFFYAHPQNRFWKVLASIYGENLPIYIEEKMQFLHKNRIALWDTIFSCDIIASSDSSIKNVEPTNLLLIIENSKIERIFCNGKTALKYYEKYHKKVLNMPAMLLPSTSPANASISLTELINIWANAINKS